MRKFLLTLGAIVALCGTSLAWGTRGHATTVKIAENHLTKKAKKQITEYLHGESIVKWASYADDSKPELLVDCLLYTSPSPRDSTSSRMPSSA